MPRLLTLVIVFALIAGCGTATPLSTPLPAALTPTVIPTSTSLPTPTAIPSPIPNTLYVNPSQSLGPISPLIYGSNYGPWLVVSFEMLQQAYDSGIAILRFPAGAWGDENDMRTYQIDQFMAFASEMGATLMINVRLLGGTPEQAAGIVHYVNIAKKYNVRYWGIGNEPTLYHNKLKGRGESYDTVRFNKEWREFALAMKNVDPTIKLVGPEAHQYSYDIVGTTNYDKEIARDINGLYWMDEFLKANGDLVDVVSFHRYPFPRSNMSGPPSVDELRRNTQEWDRIIISLRELIHQHTGRDLPMAITEFNSSFNKSVGGEATTDSHYNAVWLADVLGRMIKNGVFMANEFALTAKGGLGGSGLIGQYDVYPAYYAYQMYKRFGNELLYSSSDDPNVSIYAARREDGALTIMIVNLSLEERAKALRIEDQASVEAEAWLFDPTHKAENVGAMELSGAVAIPPQSVTLLVVK